MTEAVQLESGRPSRTEILTAALIIAMIVAVAVIVFSNARGALPEVRPFLPMFLTVVVLSEGLTGYLLFQRARLAQTPFYGALAGAYFLRHFWRLHNCPRSRAYSVPTVCSEPALNPRCGYGPSGIPDIPCCCCSRR